MLNLWIILSILTLVCLTLVCKPFVKRRAWLLTILVSSTVVITGGFLYWHYGSGQKWSVWQAQQTLLKQIGPPKAIIAKLEQHLKLHPDSAKGWYLLGRLTLSQEDYLKAQNAFSHADILQPHDPQILYQYAQAEYLAKHHLAPTTQQKLIQIVKKDRHALDVLNLLAVAAYQEGLYYQAIAYWRTLGAQLPTNSNEYAMIIAAIDKANAAQQAKEKPIVIQVHIVLAKSLSTWVSPRILLVYTVSLDKPMPVAIVRRVVKPQDFPLTLIVDNTMNMLNNYNLTNVKQVKVVARVSATGRAQPQKGDLQGVSNIFKLLPKQTVTITLQQVVSKPL